MLPVPALDKVQKVHGVVHLELLEELVEMIELRLKRQLMGIRFVSLVRVRDLMCTFARR